MPLTSIKDLPAKEIVKGYWGRTVHTGTMTLMYWSVKAGAKMPLHHHVHEQVAHVLSGQFELVVDGQPLLLEPGKVVVIPSDIPHSGTAITDCELLDVFHPEREDYKF